MTAHAHAFYYLPVSASLAAQGPRSPRSSVLAPRGTAELRGGAELRWALSFIIYTFVPTSYYLYFCTRKACFYTFIHVKHAYHSVLTHVRSKPFPHAPIASASLSSESGRLPTWAQCPSKRNKSQGPLNFPCEHSPTAASQRDNDTLPPCPCPANHDARAHSIRSSGANCEGGKGEP